MKQWYLVSFKFMNTGLLYHKLVLTDREEKIFPHFAGNEEIQFRHLEEGEIDVLKKVRLPIVSLTTK